MARGGLNSNFWQFILFSSKAGRRRGVIQLVYSEALVGIEGELSSHGAAWLVSHDAVATRVILSLFNKRVYEDSIYSCSDE